MSFGDFFKKQNNFDIAPNPRINKNIPGLLNRGVPFIVTLPITETVKTSGFHAVSVRVGPIGRGFYSPPEYKTIFRKVYTNVKVNEKQVIIEHALSNGQHIFINNQDIEHYGKYNEGLSIELIDGTQYIFDMDKDIMDYWKKVGLDTHLLIFEFLKLIRTPPPQPPKPCPNCGKLTSAKKGRCEHCNYIIFPCGDIKPLTRLQKAILSGDPERIKRERELVERGEKFQICPNCGEQLLSDATICEFCKTELNNKESNSKTSEETDIKNDSIKVNEDPFLKIKEAKELLDIGAITQDEFEKIKSKYLKQI